MRGSLIALAVTLCLFAGFHLYFEPRPVVAGDCSELQPDIDLIKGQPYITRRFACETGLVTLKLHVEGGQ